MKTVGAHTSSNPVNPAGPQAGPVNAPTEPLEKRNGEQANAPPPPPRQPVGPLGNDGFNLWHLLALPIFACLYVLVQRKPALVGITVVALFACLLYRLDPIRRRIALAPVSFATVLLINHIVTYTLKAEAPFRYGTEKNLPELASAILRRKPLLHATAAKLQRKFLYCRRAAVAGIGPAAGRRLSGNLRRHPVFRFCRTDHRARRGFHANVR